MNMYLVIYVQGKQRWWKDGEPCLWWPPWVMGREWSVMGRREWNVMGRRECSVMGRKDWSFFQSETVVQEWASPLGADPGHPSVGVAWADQPGRPEQAWSARYPGPKYQSCGDYVMVMWPKCSFYDVRIMNAFAVKAFQVFLAILPPLPPGQDTRDIPSPLPPPLSFIPYTCHHSCMRSSVVWWGMACPCTAAS